MPPAGQGKFWDFPIERSRLCTGTHIFQAHFDTTTGIQDCRCLWILWLLGWRIFSHHSALSTLSASYQLVSQPLQAEHDTISFCNFTPSSPDSHSGQQIRPGWSAHIHVILPDSGCFVHNSLFFFIWNGVLGCGSIDYILHWFLLLATSWGSYRYFVQGTFHIEPAVYRK